MPVAKPTDLTPWATSATGIAASVQPVAGQSTDGWAVAQKPPSQYFNWMMNRYGQWVNWLNDISNQAFTWTSAQIFSALATFSAGLTSAGAATFNALATFTASITTNGISIGAAWAAFTGGNPASNTAFTNTITPKHIAKAWALITTDGAGGVAIVDGVNVTSVAIQGSAVRVTLASAFNTATGWAPLGSLATFIAQLFVQASRFDSTHVDLAYVTSSTGAVAPAATTAGAMTVVIFGAQ